MSDWLRTATLGLALGAILVAAAGCGGSSFVGRQFDNFTAYYNTFYNATNAFDEGVKALERTERPVDRRYYVDVFTVPDNAGNNASFQDAIDKSADVLRGHPDSRWVDDALLLIGKSYFYLQNFVGAEQKFREVIDIGSALEDEASLWLARTLIAAGSYNEARDHLVVTLGMDEEVSDRWEPRLRLALGELYVKQEDYEAAADELEAGLESVRDNDLEARGWMLLGQVLETLERYEDSMAAYDHVSRAHPRYELSYAANVSAIRVQGLYVDADEALQRLRRMQRDDKNFSNRLELAYIGGLIHQAQGRVGEARERYHEILYDSDGQIGDLRGRIHYALGELYQNVFEDYLAASAHFDTASTALSNMATNGRAQVRFAPEAIVDASEKAEMFATFADVRNDIARMDSLLDLGRLDDEEFMERIMDIRRQRASELSEQQRQVEERQAERGFQEAATRGQSGETQLTVDQSFEEAGFLFHRDRARVQENRMNFIMRWGERPHVPNWRRGEAVAAAVSDGDVPEDAVAARIMDGDAEAGTSPLPQIDYSDVPRDSLSRARMITMRALARYELGNVLFLSMDRPDSAAAWYRMVIEEDPSEDVAQRAYYALAEVQRSLGDTARAQSLYEQVLRDFPTSDFAGRVREQLGIREDVPSDSLAIAFEDYDRAAARWQRGLHREALDEMVSLAATYRRTEVAPKALLAAGRIYLELAEKDSLDVFDPLPLGVGPDVIDGAGLRTGTAANAASNSANDHSSSVPSGNQSNMESSSNGSNSSSTAESEASDAGRSAGGSSEPPHRREANDDSNAGGEPDVLPIDSTSDGASPQSDGASAQNPPSGDAETARDEESGLQVRSTPEQADEVPDDSSRAASVQQSADLTDSARQQADHDSTAVPSLTVAADSSLLSVGVTPGLRWQNGEQYSGGEPTERDAAVYLQALYDTIKERYPTTLYARQADEMLRALETYRAEMQAAADSVPAADAGETAATARTGAAEDTTAIGLADEAADTTAIGLADEASDTTAIGLADEVADTTASALADRATDTTATALADEAADTTASALAGDAAETTAPSDTLVAEADTTATIPNGEASLRGEGGIDQQLGGFTLVLGMNVQQEPMEALARKYADTGFRTDVITERIGGTTLYRAALGHFASAGKAQRALQEHAADLEDGVQVAPVRQTPPSQ